jgi:hypothetical protein
MLRQSDQQVLGIDLNCSESTEALLAHVLPVSKIAHTTVAYETAALRNFDPANVADGSCVDGSRLARAFFTFCSIGRCSHVFGLLTRFT